MQPLYLLTAVDVRRAEQTDTSRVWTIDKITLPPIRFVEVEHTAGGGVGTVGFLMPRVEKIEPAFGVKGVDIDAFAGFGQVDRWVFAGSYHDRRTGAKVGGRAVIEGAIRTWEPDESSPTEFQGCNYSFAEVTHYEFVLNGKEHWYWDNWERVCRSDGIDHFAAERRALGV
ncbi:phage major tail tube protein [Afifella sp. H1R]|uniref:phage major tail tube protein n=1 Tax=Afifella sp. H1R TaxID=2908841 RepID=UPI001F3AE134|nr:phage major tail tube protein [Afifella sp. H1R]MCF1502898.1 phage major tail tube protein [Afifella sp. H1R]